MAKALGKFRLRVLFSLGILSILLLVLNKKPSISFEDERYIKAFLKEWHISETPAQVHQNFNNEIFFISKIQDSVIAEIKHQEVPHFYFGNVKYYFTVRKGYCYDRAVLLEKIMMLYGFNFRHIFIYYNNDKLKTTTLADFFKKKTGSHALIEVETKNGWMAVDANCNWMGITKEGKLITASVLKKMVEANQEFDFKKQPCIGAVFWQDHPNFRFFYGFYSRHGSFFSPHLGLPEINFKMLMYNF